MYDSVISDSGFPDWSTGDVLPPRRYRTWRGFTPEGEALPFRVDELEERVAGSDLKIRQRRTAGLIELGFGYWRHTRENERVLCAIEVRDVSTLGG